MQKWLTDALTSLVGEAVFRVLVGRIAVGLLSALVAALVTAGFLDADLLAELRLALSGL